MKGGSLMMLCSAKTTWRRSSGQMRQPSASCWKKRSRRSGLTFWSASSEYRPAAAVARDWRWMSVAKTLMGGWGLSPAVRSAKSMTRE